MNKQDNQSPPAPAAVTEEASLRSLFESWAADEWDGKTPPDAAWIGFKGHASLATPHPAVAVPGSLKGHQIAALVNDLRDIAIEFHGAQQLRERISHRVRDALATTSTAAQPESGDA